MSLSVYVLHRRLQMLTVRPLLGGQGIDIVLLALAEFGSPWPDLGHQIAPHISPHTSPEADVGKNLSLESGGPGIKYRPSHWLAV